MPTLKQIIYPLIAVMVIFSLVNPASQPVQAAGSLTVGSIDSASGHSANNANLTYSFTNTAGNVLLVCATSGNPNQTISGITYGGAAMAKAVETYTHTGLSGGGGDVTLWYLANPATGANNVVVTKGGSGGSGAYVISGAISFTGANTANPIKQTASSNGTSGTATNVNVANTTVGNYVVDCAAKGSALGSSRTTFNFKDNVNNNDYGNNGASSYAPATGGTITMGTTGDTDDGWGIVAAEVAVSGVTDTTPPSAPTNLSATTISSSAINLSWTASTDDVGVTGYKIYRNGTQIGTSATNSYSDTGLAASTNYSYTVSAYDAAGNNSSQSSSASATTQSAPLTAPVISSFTANPSSITSGNSSTLSWSVSGNPAPTLSISSIGTVTGSSQSVSPTVTTIYTLTATNSQGQTTANATVTVTQPDTTPPSTPTGLSASAVSSSQINLTWTASTDNVGVTNYTIYRGGIQIGSSPTNSYSDSGLSASTQYTYTISAQDAAGNTSAQSVSASATTQVQQTGSYLWSNLIDPSRAIDWTSAGFTIPNYSTNCSNQPALLTGSGNAASNTTKIQNALASCDATHNVVNIPAGTYYVAGIGFGTQGFQVLRGAGPNSTTLIPTTENNCGGLGAGICSIDADPKYNQSAEVLPGGSQQCAWSGTNGVAGTYTQGATTINLTGCGGTPPVNGLILMDQADDTTDTGGVYICDGNAKNCTYGGTGSIEGRVISGIDHGQAQTTYVTSVVSHGGGAYTITISPGVYFNNIRSSQSPGVWWSGMIRDTGVENMTVDGSKDPEYTIGMYDCYQCWVKNTRLLDGGRASVTFYQSAGDVVRDSYFYQAQGHQSVSYNIESQLSSAFLIENNIMQQVTTPFTFNTATGAVADYNYSIDTIAFPQYAWAAFVSHNAGNDMSLFEGNNFVGFVSDNSWGSSVTETIFRNMLNGWSHGDVMSTTPIVLRGFSRAYNVIGNVMGEPGYHTQYQTYATSNSGGPGGANEDTSIYSLGWAFGGGSCGTGTVNTSPTCDAKTFSTLMRWGNYDTVTSGIKWDSTEASPAAVPYANANFTTSYFSSLAHTLPTSLYYNSKPSWWPTADVWPPVGPDVLSGNLGICNGGTYAGAQATASSQCTGGTLATAYAGHANTIPAQDCYLNVMHGAPDGTGSVLAFDATTCYSSGGSSDTTPPSTPTGLSATAVSSSAINLSWTTSSDNVGVSGYKVFRNGTQITTTSSTSYSDTGLSASTNYSYTVSAYDAAGNNSTQSSSASATTQASATPVPGDFNLDHVVNTLDFSLLNSKWLQSYPSYDLYVDNIINSLDYAIMSSNWGKTW